MDILMKCGHSAQGTDGDGNPVCAICLGVKPGAREVATKEEAAQVTEGRMMRCSYRKGQNGHPCARRLNPMPSSTKAAFFASKPNEEYDEYYCGCWGWD